MKTKAAVPQPAIVDVTVDSGGFIDIINTNAGSGFDRLCAATVRLRTPAPDGISQAAPTFFNPYPPLIVKQDMKIDFRMPFSTNHEFRLTGVSFRRKVGTGVSNGHDNLPKGKITMDEDATSSTISIRDVYAKHGKPGTINWIGWELYLFVQNTSGDIGIIDPDILNEE